MIRTMHLMIVTALALPTLCGCAFMQRILPGLTMSDSNLISVVDSLGENEIDAALLAQQKASAPEVQAFAGRVLNEHRQLAEANAHLAKQRALQPEPPALSAELKRAHEQAMQRLRAQSGAAFDRAYLKHEIQQHVLAFQFMEAAAESEAEPTLKQALVRTGPDLLSHISAARALERHLGLEAPEAIASR
jgi:putative membrane protein